MALAWVLRSSAVTSVLIGASKTAQIEDAVGMLANRHFSTEELGEIEAILNRSN
jgi:L-glyceraldehyde 3-phosphate reductase